jgi:hypothetical protein
MERLACQLIWIDPSDCDPPHSLDMSSEHDYTKVEMLLSKFLYEGFDKNYPALVGYPLEKRIQLLSGTHRHMAAKIAGVKLPVTLWLRSDIEERWGTDLWDATISDIPVKELESYPVKDGFIISPYERVDLSKGKEQ